MPFGNEGPASGIGLTLSSGGFRTILLHGGVFCRFNNVACPEKLDRVSTMSGDSGVLGGKWAKLIKAYLNDLFGTVMLEDLPSGPPSLSSQEPSM